MHSFFPNQHSLTVELARSTTCPSRLKRSVPTALKPLVKLEEVAGREAELVESLPKARETHSAEVDVLRVQHAQVL